MPTLQELIAQAMRAKNVGAVKTDPYGKAQAEFDYASQPPEFIQAGVERVPESLRPLAELLAPSRADLVTMGTAKAGRGLAKLLTGGTGALKKAVLGPAARDMTVYHGTPHLFAPTPKNVLGEFDPTKIGIGEGTQVFSKGAYLAQKPSTASTYLGPKGANVFNEIRALLPKNMHGNALHHISLLHKPDDWTPAYEQAWDQADDLLKKHVPTGIESHIAALNAEAGRLSDAISGHTGFDDKSFQRWANTRPLRGALLNKKTASATYLHTLRNRRDYAQKTAKQLRTLLDQPGFADAASKIELGGYLYDVDLPDPLIDKMLNWDLAMHKQSPHVQEAIYGRLLPTMERRFPSKSREFRERVELAKKPPYHPVIERLYGVSGPDLFALWERAMEYPRPIWGVPFSRGGRIDEVTGELPPRLEQLLEEVDVPGVKFFDRVSRNLPDVKREARGTRNFVVYPAYQNELQIMNRSKIRR